MTKQHRVIRADGTQEALDTRPSFDEIRRLIGCEALDYVTINRRRQTLMLVDDTGMIDGKPVNLEATRRYHRICRPGTTHQIHGDVVILNDNSAA